MSSVMPIQPHIRAVFDHFHNLNLLALMEDLRVGRTPRQAWRSGSWLCPIAHGLPAGKEVSQVSALGQIAEHREDCLYAARQLGAAPEAVERFVTIWDDQTLTSDWLLRQLEELWVERLADAEVMEELLK